MQQDSVVPAGALGVSLACSINTAIYGVGRSMGGDFTVQLPWEKTELQLGILDVFAATAAAMVFGILLYLLIDWLTPKHSWDVWRLLIIAVFVMSVVPYHPSFTVRPRFWLSLLHLTPPLSLFGSLRAAHH